MAEAAPCDHLIAVEPRQEYGQELLEWTRASRPKFIGMLDVVSDLTGGNAFQGAGVSGVKFNFCPICGTKLTLPT